MKTLTRVLVLVLAVCYGASAQTNPGDKINYELKRIGAQYSLYPKADSLKVAGLVVSGTTSASGLQAQITSTAASVASNASQISTLSVTKLNVSDTSVFVRKLSGYRLISPAEIAKLAGSASGATAVDSTQLLKKSVFYSQLSAQGVKDGQQDAAISTNSTAITTKQNTLVSGTNIKTVNGNSLLGSGDVSTLDSPSFTGTPTAPTAATTVNNTQIATTAFVQQLVATGGSLPASASATIADNASHVATMTALENEFAFRDFWDKIYNYAASAAGKLIVIAGYGDSVSDHLTVPFFRGLSTIIPAQTVSNPYNGAITTPFAMTFTGVIPYNVGSVGSQTILDGKVTVSSLTRSGSTATATTTVQHGLSVGGYVTISGATQTEYNGTFVVASAPSTTQFTYAVTGTPTSPATTSTTITAYGGATDFTYLPSAEHIELADGATVTMGVANKRGTTKWKTYLATGPGMGSAQVDLLDYVTSSVVSTSTVSLSAGSLGATAITFPTSTSAIYKLKITATGKVVNLMNFALPDNGLVHIHFGRGGTTFTQNQFSNDAIFNFIAQDMGLSLVIVEAKEENLPASLTPLATRLNSLTATTKFIVGSAPSFGQQTPDDNAIYRTWALANNWAYFSMFKAMGSYAESIRLGWLTNIDNVHPADVQNSYMANMVLAKTGILTLYGTNMMRNVDASNVRVQTLQMQDVDPSKTFTIAKLYGSTQTGVGIMQNMRGYFTKQASGVAIGIAGYDANTLVIKDSSFVDKSLRADRYTATGASGTSTLPELTVTKLRVTGTAPTCTTNTGAGTGATVSYTGGEMGGIITITTGTSPVQGGVICRVTLSSGTVPIVTVTPSDTDISATQRDRFKVANRNTTYYELVNVGTALDANTTYTFGVHVMRL